MTVAVSRHCCGGHFIDWPDRTLVSQWHRGTAPGHYRSFAVRSQDWKLVQSLGGGDHWDGRMDFQLYDMANDPFEMHNVAREHPERVATLKAAYDRWFEDVTGGRDYSEPQRITVGAAQENPVLLTRQDWRGPNASWSPGGIGYWEINIAANARYDIRLRFDSTKADGTATLSCAGGSAQQSISAGDEECVLRDLQLPAGPARLEAILQEGSADHGVRYVEIHRLD